MSARRGIRARIGWKLRCIADRIDRDHAALTTSMTFTFEHGEGIVFHTNLNGPMNGRGCPVWYPAHEYDRAHTEAASALRGEQG